MQEDKRSFQGHNVTIEDRERVTITGALDIESFDDTQIVVITDYGDLTVKGDLLKVHRLSVETGDITISGEIESLDYEDNNRRKEGGGILGRLFR